MKHLDELVKKAAVVLMGVALMGLSAVAVDGARVDASETEIAETKKASAADLDLTQTGAIELTLTDINGEIVSGGTVTIYQVAKLYLDDGDMAYEYTEDFADCEIELDVTDTSLAAALVEYLKENPAAGIEQEIGTDGTVSFTDLELGLYLVVQTAESDNYKTFNPFVVTVPIDNDGEWNYTVDASPKVDVLLPEETETEPTTEPETETEPTTEPETETEPTTEPGTETEPTTEIETETEPTTEPESETETETETESESETETETEIETDTEIETETETETEAEPETESETTPQKESEPSKESEPVTESESETETDTPTLPQTGQLNWPIPVLAVGGFLILIVGWILKNREKKDDRYAS